jgi:hypothetical protein
MNNLDDEIDEKIRELFKRDLSASEWEAAHNATLGDGKLDGRKLKRARRNAVQAVRRKVTGHAERHRRREPR